MQAAGNTQHNTHGIWTVRACSQSDVLQMAAILFAAKNIILKECDICCCPKQLYESVRQQQNGVQTPHESAARAERT